MTRDMSDTAKESSDRLFLTTEQALSLLPKKGQVHTFRSGSMTLIGADWNVKELINILKTSTTAEIGGDQCKRMGHGLVIWTGSDPLFVQVDKIKLSELEAAIADSLPPETKK